MYTWECFFISKHTLTIDDLPRAFLGATRFYTQINHTHVRKTTRTHKHTRVRQYAILYNIIAPMWLFFFFILIARLLETFFPFLYECIYLDFPLVDRSGGAFPKYLIIRYIDYMQTCLSSCLSSNSLVFFFFFWNKFYSQYIICAHK